MDNTPVNSAQNSVASPITGSLESMDQESTQAVLSVEQLNRHIRQLIEGELSLVWVQAEISNFKAHTSGHFYFSLKDSKSQIRAVMFRGHNSRLKFKPHDGLEVLIRGRVTVYEPRGDYQIAVETMEPVGAGALQKAFEQLKLKLKTEGLFETARKRPLPALPKHVAIVTSPTGAAIRDMLNILNRRNRTVKITLIPTIVQGETAAPLIVTALKTAFQLPDLDVIIIGRGGGSMEDLWAFNDEALARTIASSPVPVISAVGHEIDFTISDFVSDLRAPTPSAAAELVVKSSEDLQQRMKLFDRLLLISMQKMMRTEMQRLKGLQGRLTDPKRKLQDLIQRADELSSRLHQSVNRYLENRKLQLRLSVQKIPSPEKIISQTRSRIESQEIQMKNIIGRSLDRFQFRLKESMSMLEGLSPLRVVERGYSMVMFKDQLVKKAKQLKSGDEISIVLMEGRLKATVNETITETK